MTLAIKPGLSASTFTNLSPWSTGHFASIISIAASIGLIDPLGVGRNPIGRRHVVPEGGDELCTFRRWKTLSGGQDFMYGSRTTILPSGPHNGRFLRHRPQRNERCLN